jgi:cytochrome c peroxidase
MNKNSSLISIIGLFTLGMVVLQACKKEESNTTIVSTPSIDTIFKGAIDLNHLENYAQQGKPGYITKDNTGSNGITNEGATLGRVLFYDKNLSINNSISCASCHKQSLAFGDTAVASIGVNGLTGRHSMRLVNARFGMETKFFWDERASSLENQTSQPIFEIKLCTSLSTNLTA